MSKKIISLTLFFTLFLQIVSIDDVNAITAEDAIAGIKYGTKILKKTCVWLAPKSNAASSWVWSNLCKRATKIRKQYVDIKHVCPKIVRKIPLRPMSEINPSPPIVAIRSQRTTVDIPIITPGNNTGIIETE